MTDPNAESIFTTLDLETEAQSFFLLPVEVIRELNADLSRLVGASTAKSMMFKAGFTAGRSVVQRMGFPYIEPSQLSQVLPDLWIEIGIGLIAVDEATDEHILIRAMDSNEANALGLTGTTSCNLTRGFLTGVCSTLVGYEFECTETECLSRGDPRCSFILTPANSRDGARFL